jgi:hypothetical protein
MPPPLALLFHRQRRAKILDVFYSYEPMAAM